MGLGCLANLVAETEHLAVQMEGLIPLLVSCSSHPELSGMALLALTNIAVDEKMVATALNAGAMDLMVKKLASPDSDDVSYLCGALNAMVADNTFADTFFDHKDGFELLFRLLDAQLHPEIDADADEEDIQDARDDSNAVVKSVIAILQDLASETEEGRRRFLKNGQAIPRLISYTLVKDDSATSWSNLPEEASKVVAYLSLDSEINRVVLFPEAQVFLQWLDTSRTIGTEERRMSAGMILGNLAEDEKSASKLIEMGVSTSLCRELFRGLDLNSGTTHEESANIAEAAQNSERDGKEMRIKHLCCAGLKNLAIHPDHKSALIKMGILPSLVALLKQRNQVVAHAALGLVKSLLISEEALEPYLVADPGAATIMELTNTDEENKKDDHLLYESSRVIGMLAVRHPKVFEAYMPEPTAEVAEQLSKIDGKKYLSPFTAIANLVHSKFGILQREGTTVIVAALELFPNSHLPISKVPGLIERALELLKAPFLGETDTDTVFPKEGLDTASPLALLVKLLLTSSNEIARAEASAKAKTAAAEWIEKAVQANPEGSKFYECVTAIKNVM